ncbi:MAG: DUF47 family protein [Gammaproteobacteria bacterium]|nr:DUF47 family protein [Gammaproteobacteria bacterium]MBU1415721.1 DUF47 family protein [Gammaproteobacteria bacterium]
MSDEQAKSLPARLFERFFPKTPDFFSLLHKQSLQVVHTVGLLVRFMETNEEAISLEIRADEHAADRVKMANVHILNEAFSTPIDREDIYRAIMTLDEVVNGCKDAVNDMHALSLLPDEVTLEFSRKLLDGVRALEAGFGKLATNPADAAHDADAARKAERKIEKFYRKALAQLFQGDDYLNMLKRREIYRHLITAAERMAHCANTLHDIVVKMV